MENVTHKNQIVDLVAAITSFSSTSGPDICGRVEENSKLLLFWIQYLNSYHLTGTANNLLAATVPALREVAASLSIGMIRPALFSLRSQIDFLLTWLFFKDHSVEWDYVNRTGDGFKMKKDLIFYLSTYHESFSLRFGILKEIAKRREEEPYRLLSAHIHGQSTLVLPDAFDLRDLVNTEAECIDCVDAVYEVSEYLNDILIAIYCDNWQALPLDIRNALEQRFVTANQKAIFFAGKKE